MKPVCFLDMDGVLVDFTGGAFKLHGRSIPVSEIQWDFCSQMGFDGTDDTAFWAPMGFEFWRDLDWTTEGCDLLDKIELIFGGPENVCLLSSPCKTPGCIDGKLAWIAKNAPQYSRRNLIGKPKELVASPHKILVDDYDANVEKFAKAGGRTVLIPRSWNRRRNETSPVFGLFDVDAIANELELLASETVPLDVHSLIFEAHDTAKSKGWWSPVLGQPERTFGDQIALMHSELSEALEEFRSKGLGQDSLLYFVDDGKGGKKPEGIAAEFADVLIRIADTCGYYDIPLARAILKKLAYNRSRPFRHGGKVI